MELNIESQLSLSKSSGIFLMVKVETKIAMDAISRQFDAFTNCSDEIFVDFCGYEDESTEEYKQAVELLSKEIMDGCVGAFVLFHP
jgi:hypothetical protein